MSNPFVPYAFFPKKKPVGSQALPVISNFCQLIGRELEEDRVEVSYCSCDNCVLMPTAVESVCCQEVLQASTKWATNWKNFIGESDECFCNNQIIRDAIRNLPDLKNFIKFDQIRLKQVARITRSFYIDEYEAAEENDKYRFACYRKITFLVHDIMGVGKRVEIPDCIVTLVRETFPSENNTYTGFEQFSYDSD